MKLIEILLEQQSTTTIDDLKFGINIQKGDHLPNPNSDSNTRINDEEDLENWKKDKYPLSKVIIDRNQPWFNIFNIPDFERGREEFRKRKGSYLDTQR